MYTDLKLIYRLTILAPYLLTRIPAPTHYPQTRHFPNVNRLSVPSTQQSNFPNTCFQRTPNNIPRLVQRFRQRITLPCLISKIPPNAANRIKIPLISTQNCINYTHPGEY